MSDPLTVIRMREGGHVQRCHCFPHHGSYDVAQHTWHMLALLEMLHPDPPRALYSAIIRHDVFERWTGDIPAVTSQIMPEMKVAKTEAEARVSQLIGIQEVGFREELTTEDLAWIKALDSVEFLMWCDDQLAMGNRLIETKRDNVMDTLQNSWESWPHEIRSFLDDYRWTRTNDDILPRS